LNQINESLRLIRSAENHLINKEFGISCYESRLSAIISLKKLADYLNLETKNNTLRELYKQINRFLNLNSIKYCIDYLDSLKNLEISHCDTYCADEIPGSEILEYANKDDAERAIKCSREIYNFLLLNIINLN
jgi:HEPN domain-containing protein